VLVFERRPISRERWARHREQIMREDAGEGRRQPEWWIYEKDQEPPEEREAAMLLEMGELGKSELARLMKHWREKWEKALKDHGFCCGHKPGSNTDALWLEGIQARKAWCRFWGIPAKLVLQWGRERRRSEKIVRALEEQPWGYNRKGE